MHRIAALAFAGFLAAAVQPAWAQSAPDKPAAAPAPAPAEKRPMFETKKVEGTDNVYIFRYGNHQSMFVVTGDGVIATDPISYGRPQAAETYVAEIKKITDKPIKYLVYSHHHFDHIAGGKPFKDAGARIIAHERVKHRLEILKDPATLPPDEVFKDRRTLKLGATTLELSYIGLNHSDSTIVMRLPKEKIVFAVDFMPVGSMPGVGMIDSYPLEWEASLKKLAAMDWERLIPGHPGQPGGRLGTKKDVQDFVEFMQYASAEVKEQARAGKCWQPAEKEVMLSKYANLPGYENGRAHVVRRFCGLWGRGT
jgi:glyoxylase-like metal-dependent hydrolase (beta-lactamase superfamily II)